MRSWILAAGLLVALGGTAGADELLTQTPEVPKGKSLKKRVQANVDEFAEQFGLHLSRLSFDLLQMDFDVKKKKAKVKVDAGDGENLGLKVDSDVKFHGNYARVNAKVNLALGGQTFELDLPEFDVVHSKYDGEQGVELRLPLIHGRF